MRKVCLQLLPFLLSCALSAPTTGTDPYGESSFSNFPFNATYYADAAENVNENKEQSKLTRALPTRSGSITVNAHAITMQFFITDESRLRKVEQAIFNRPINFTGPEIRADYTVFSKSNGFITAYKFQKTRKTWSEARKICAQEGAYLAYPTSAIEEAEFQKMKSLNKADYIWVGLHDFFEEGEWTSVTGESLRDISYVNWNENEPNNAKEGEHCAQLSPIGLNDISCKQSHPYICKIYIQY